jgi:hypothetical protein
MEIDNPAGAIYIDVTGRCDKETHAEQADLFERIERPGRDDGRRPRKYDCPDPATVALAPAFRKPPGPGAMNDASGLFSSETTP